MKTFRLKYPQFISMLLLALTTHINLTAQQCIPPNITGTAPGSRCGVGTVTLGATADPGTVIKWYNTATGGTPVATGSVYTTPSLTATTHFYATASHVSPGSKAIGAGASSGKVGAFNLTNGMGGGLKVQYLYTATELLNAGFRAGNMSSLGFNLTQLGSNLPASNFGGFAVQMGTTSINSFTTVNMQGGLTTVYAASTQTPVLGMNTLIFTTPYNWDGVSNIIISVSWSNANFGNAGSAITCDVTSNYSSQMYTDDYQTAAYMLAYTGFNIGSPDGRLSHAKSRPMFTINGMIICESPRTAVVATLNPPPALSLTTGTSVCTNVVLPLHVISPLVNYNAYTWSPVTNLYSDAGATLPYTGGSATTVYYKSTTQNTTAYTVSATNSVSGCGNITSTSVIAHTPLINVTANPPVICSGATLSLTATGASSYTWSPGSSMTASTTATPTTSTTYTVTGQELGCSNSRTVNVAVNHSPIIAVTTNPSHATLCTTGETATLTAAGTSTAYAWNSGENTASIVVAPSATASYTVTGTNSCGTITKVIPVSVARTPTISAVSSSTLSCANHAVVLTAEASPGVSYLWNTGAATATISVSPNLPATYAVTGTNACGTATAAVLQNVSPCTGTEDLKNAPEVVIYPNPAHDYISISIPASFAFVNTTIEVTDALGKVVIKEVLTENVSTLNISKFNEGVYFFKVTRNNQAIKIGKVVKW